MTDKLTEQEVQLLADIDWTGGSWYPDDMVQKLFKNGYIEASIVPGFCQCFDIEISATRKGYAKLKQLH